MKPSQINQILSKVQKPLTYIACEDNACLKPIGVFGEPALHFCLIYPDLYELGIGSLGINILYSILNKQKDVWAQRAYMPDIDMQEILQEEKIALFSLEKQKPLNQFDLLGFSLPHELSYTNILKMLELSLIPIQSKNRNDDHPIIIAGGNGAFNPLPLSPFIDAFVIGDGEEVVLEIVEAVQSSELGVRSKKLEALSKITGVWIPRIAGPLTPNSELRTIKKRTVADINQITYEPLIPTSRGEKRLVAEIMRGCTSGCRFCQAGFINRPLREKEAEKIVDDSSAFLADCGLNQLSLLSLSTSDYSQVEPLVSVLSDKIKSKNISISLPSLRLDDFSVSVLKQISVVKKTGLTFAIEAGSQRLRDLINKRLSEEQIINTLSMVFAQGWTRVKLYFMIGLPTETDDDLQQLVQLVNKIAQIAKEKLGSQRKKLKLIISVSNYVPKPHTPFQWCAQDDLATLQKKLNYLKDSIKGPVFSLKWHNSEQSTLEGLLARGDEKVAQAIEEAYKLGAQFDNFSERFNFKIWQKALEQSEVSIDDYLGERDLDKPLAWSFISSGVSDEFLKEEFEKAVSGQSTEDCRDGKCPQCGVCDKELKNLFSAAPSPHPPLTPPSREGDERYKYRLYIKREGMFKFLSHLDWINLLERRLRQADLDLVSKGKYNPRPKLSYSQALPVGSEQMHQHVDFTIKNDESIKDLESKFRKVFKEGLVFEDLERCRAGSPNTPLKII